MSLHQQALLAAMKGEQTPLSPADEALFQQWVKQMGITDLDAPESRYDYRGYWNDIARKGGDERKAYDDGQHFPDTYKQHGHPSFSVESKYSRGKFDGGRWVGEDYVPNGADALTTSRSTPDGDFLMQAVRALVANAPRRLR